MEVEFREFYCSNGDYYKGFCLRGQYVPHGWGIKTTSTSTYEGSFKDGLEHGFGKVCYNIDSPALTQSMILSYEGGFRAGHYHGEGTATYWLPTSSLLSRQRGAQYTGGWLWGDKSGQGTMTYERGAKYEGGWMENVQSGWGTMTYEDGVSHEGGWKDGKKEGYGVSTVADGTKYEGSWLADNIKGLQQVTRKARES